MAFVPVFVFAVRVLAAPGGVAAYRTVQRMSEAGQPTTGQSLKFAIDQLSTSGESDSALSGTVSALLGYSASVATYEGSFEVRRVQHSFEIDSGILGGDDVRVITFHLLKLVAGAPSATWVAGDFTGAESAFAAWWLDINQYYTARTKLVKRAYYKAGPAITPPQAPVFQADLAITGDEGNTTAQLPPQVALTVTEKSGPQRNWGRFYLPAPAAGRTNEYGRPSAGFISAIATATDTLYEALKTNGTPVVIYLPALPIRSPAASDPRYKTVGTYAARTALARTVDELQVDNVWDVIRSRRYDRSTDRQTRVIA